MTEILITPATDADLVRLAPRLREADRVEVEAAGGRSPLDALRRSLALSVEAWSATAGGEPMCCWGVGSLDLLAGVGSPWLLGSDLVERHPLAFLRRTRPTIRRWLDLFPVLANHVDVRNALSVRWLGWLGFDVRQPVPYGPRGLPFHPFLMRRHDV